MNKKLYAIIIPFLILSMNCTGNKFLPPSGEKDPEEMMKFVDGDRYFKDLSALAVDRTPKSSGHRMAMDYCARRLAELGYKVELDLYGTGVNVLGILDGTTNPDEIILLSAHYDTRYAGCPGADDNASGVAGALEAARVLAKGRYPRTLMIALWDEEEQRAKGKRGLYGSRAFAGKARLDGKKIVLAMVLEMIGYCSSEPGSQIFPAGIKKMFPAEMNRIAANKNRGDFICLTVNEDAKKYAYIYAGYAGTMALPSLTLNITRKIFKIHAFRRSDHAAFWENGYSAMMIGDTINYRNINYHCYRGRADDVSRLNTAFSRDTVKAAVATAVFILDRKI